MAVNKLVVDCGQPVIDDHVHPLPEAPEVEMEDAGISIRLLGVPFLLLPVWDDLGRQDEGNERHLAPERKGVHDPKETGVWGSIPPLNGHCRTCQHSGLGTWVPYLSQSETQALSSHRLPSPQASLISVPSTPATQASPSWKPAAMTASFLSPSPPKRVLSAPAFPSAPPCSPHHL